jgi:hypothetical protein
LLSRSKERLAHESIANLSQAPVHPICALLAIALVLSACGSSSATKTVTTTTTVTVAANHTPTQTRPVPPIRGRHSVPARTTPRTVVAPTPSATGNPAVDATTSDGAVVSLDDGSVYSVSDGDVSSWSSGDEVAVSDAQDSLTNLSTSDNVSVSYVGDTSDDSLYSGAGQSQDTSSDDGSLLVLDDGSVWAVTDPSDQGTASQWQDGASIIVNDSSPGYLLVNTDDDETVHANYIGDE